MMWGVPPGYSPLDFTVLDPHWGTLADWQNTIDEIHKKGMYLMVEFILNANIFGNEDRVAGR